MTSRLRIPLEILLWVLPLLLVCDSAASDVKSRNVRCGEVEQAYLYYSPESRKQALGNSTGNPLPAVMLLHGAGDRAGNMVDAWKHLAAKEKIVLLAPELPRDEKYEAAAPEVFRCVVEDAKQLVPIDRERVYLFGNSMGGYLAYDGAMFESQYFAAIAVHAMRIADDYTWIVGRAERKTPIAIYIGDHDQFFPVESVRKTRDLLLKAGFPVHYVEMDHHDHNLRAVR